MLVLVAKEIDMANRRAIKLLAVVLAAGTGAADAGTLEPRRLANGRPACGNTGGKASPPADCTPAEIEAATAALERERAAEQRQAEQRAAAEQRRVAVRELRSAIAAILGVREATP
jgi:predicted outer membrane protein